MKGDTIKVIAPSSPFRRASFRRAVTWLEEKGYRVSFGQGLFSQDDYLAGKDGRRLREYVQAWNDPKAKAIFAARGGYGSLRLFGERGTLPLKKTSKVFMGMSDLTPLLNFVAWKTGLVTVHGPVLAGTQLLSIPERKRNQLFSYLENPREKVLHKTRDYKLLSAGGGRGRLWGGNLSMVAATLGTPLEIPLERGLLFLEEIKEPPYRMDRLFAQLALAGVFRRIQGLLLGEFLDPTGKLYSQAWVKRLVKRYVPPLKPVLSGLAVGHRKHEFWLPIGGPCVIEKRGHSLRLSSLVR